MNSKRWFIILVSLGASLFLLAILPGYRGKASGNPGLLTAQPATAGAPLYKYLIHPGTGGPVACGDSLLAVNIGKRTGDVKKDAATALRSLFSTGKYSGALYNPLASSKLKVRQVEFTPSTKKYQIFLGGKLVKPDTYCEIARARAIVWATAQQFPEVRHATIWLGSGLLGDLLAANERAKD